MHGSGRVSDKSVFWTRIARSDVDAIINHIAADSVTNAYAVLTKPEKKAASLNTQSARGRIVPELKTIGVSHYRELIVKPWRIIYRIETEKVPIMAVLDSRRDLDHVLLQRLVLS
jgi:plasmid stabilization system protein ParE